MNDHLTKTKWNQINNKTIRLGGFLVLFLTLIGGTYVLFTTYTKQHHERSRIKYYDIVLLGDSLGEGVGASTPTSSFSEGVLSEVRQLHPDAQISNFATGGARLNQLIDLQLPLLTSIEADLVVIVAGANDAICNTPDAEFKDGWTTIVERATKENRHVVIMNVPKVSSAPIIPDDIKSPLNDREQRFNKIIDEVARQHARVHVFDFYNFSEQTLLGQNNLLAEDRFHPNDRGQSKMAQALGSFIREHKL